MLDSDEMRFAMEDARMRHEAVVSLILFTDQQAMALLGLYVTLGLASASGAAAGFAMNSFIPQPLALALVSATLTFTLGAWNCLAAMKTASINLPGRGPEFWLWAAAPGISFEEAATNYLNNLEQKRDANNTLNRTTAEALQRARWAGVVAPIIALLVGVLSLASLARLSP